MRILELLPQDLYLKMAHDNYIREQTHPDFKELRILNYTQSAQFDRVWNEVTEQCRGLIYDLSTGKIVARPFRKFFNYGQPECPEIDLYAPAVVMDKMDGSLGILYKTPAGYAIATRGSFNSDQAIHATKILNEKYGDWLKDQRNRELFEEYTVLFEIVYPENRIVCDYEGMDDLVLLDVVDIETGTSMGSESAAILMDWNGPVAKEFEYANMAQALEAAPRPGAEGFVVLFPETGERVKIKQEDYIALHRIVTGLNARTVWEAARKDVMNPQKFIEGLPDEFHEWTLTLWKDLKDKVRARDIEISEEYRKIFLQVLKDMGGANTREREFRKQFALAVQDHPWKSYFFQLLTDKLILDKIWDEFKPAGNMTPSGQTFTEDNK